MSKSRARLLAELLNTEGRVKKDRSDLAGADSVIDLDNLPTITNAKLENSSITIAGEALSLGGTLSLNTGHITEHTNYKYYTDTRARGAISVSGDTLSYNSTTGVITSTANNYSLPTATASVLGGVKIGYTENGKNYPVELSEGKMYVNVPWVDTNTTYSTATSSVLGLVKIGYTENGKNYPVELSEGKMYVNVPWVDTNTTYSVGDGGLTQKNFTTTLKDKLDGIAESANNYTLSTATASALGGVKIGYTENGKNYPVELSEGQMYVNVPWADTNTTYSVGDGGLTQKNFTTTLKDKLDGIAANANNYVLPFTDNSSNWDTAYGWGDHSTQSYATTTYVDTAVSNLVDSAPAALDTLNELAAALGDDANFSTTVTNSIATKLPLAGGTLTGKLSMFENNEIFGLSGTIADYPRLTFYSSEGTHASKTQTLTGDVVGQLEFSPYTGSSYTGGGKIVFLATESIISTQRGTEARIYSTKTGQASQSYHQFKDDELYIKNVGGTTHKYWHAGNDGASSGLDADTVDGQHASAFLTGNQTITLSGDVSGSGTTSIAVTVANDSHSHTKLSGFANQTEYDLIRAGNTNGLYFKARWDGATANRYWDMGYVDGYGTFYTGLKVTNGGALYYQNNTVWHAGNDGSGSGLDADTVDGIHASSFLTGNQTITLSGDVSGSGTTSIAVTVANDSHSHSLLGKKSDYTWSASTNGRDFDEGLALSFVRAADGYPDFGSVVRIHTYPNDGASAEMYFPYSNTYGGNALRYRLGQYNNAGWTGWHTVWSSLNDGSGSGLDADLLDGQQGSYYYSSGNPPPYPSDADTVDGLHAASFVRADASDTMAGHLIVEHNGVTTTPGYTQGQVQLYTSSNYVPALGFHRAGYSATTLYENDGQLYVNPWVTRAQAGLLLSSGNIGSYAWTSSNDGSGSGLDADLLDGQHGSHYLNAANFTGTAPTGSPFLSDFVHLGNATTSGYATDDGSWGARLNVSSTVHAKIEVSQEANSMRSHWYAHTGQDSIKFGTSTSHDVEFQRAGSTSLEIEAGGLMTMVPIRRNSHHASGFLEGTYNNIGANAAKTNPIYTIGSNYNPAETGLSNMYGIGFTKASDASFVSLTGASSWGMYVAADGDARIFLDSSNGTISSTGQHYVGGYGVWHTGNDGSGSGLDADLLDGNHASAFLGASATASEAYYLDIKDTRSAQFAPSDVPDHKVSAEFTNQIVSGWHSVLNLKGWHDGYATWQLIGGSDTSAHNNLYFRSGVGSSWSSTHTVWHSGVDGSGSGLDADLLDGQHGSYYQPASSAITTSSTQSSNLYIRNGSPTIYLRDTDHLPSMIHQNSNLFYVLRGASNDAAGWTTHASGAANNAAGKWPLEINITDAGNYVRFASSALQAGGYTVWHTGNDGSGSGLDADTVDGLHSSNFARGDTTWTSAAGWRQIFHSGAGGASFPNNHYSMGVDYANGAWSNPNYSDLIIGYHTGIRIGGGYSGVRFYNNSPTTDANNDGNGDGNEVLLMTVGGGGTSTSGAHVYIENSLYIKNGGSTNNVAWNAGNDGAGSGLDADNLDGVTWGSYKATGHTQINLQASDSHGVRFWNGNDQYKIFMSSQGGSGAGRQGFEPNSDYNMYFRMDGGTNRGFVFQDGAGNNKAGIDAGGNIRADGVISSNNKQAMNCAHWSASGTTTGAIKITLPGSVGSVYSMPIIEVHTYQYSSIGHVIYRISGHNWNTTSNWHNPRVTAEGGPPLAVRLGHDGTNYCIIIGETNTSWSYGSVTVELKAHPSYYAANQNFTTGWGATQITSMPSSVTAQTVGKIWHSANDGSGSGLDADSLDGYNTSTSATANTVVVREGSGHIYGNYILGTYFNAASGNSENPTIGQIWTQNTSDSYLRKSTPAHFRSQLGLWWSGNDGSGSGLDADTVDGIHGSSFLRSDADDTKTGLFNQTGGTFISHGSFESNLLSAWQIAGTGKDRGLAPFRFQDGATQQPESGNNAHWGLNIYAHAGSGGSYPYGHQLSGGSTGNLWQRWFSNGAPGSWTKLWDSANDGSGSGLDADLLDGMNASSSVAANTIVARQANGYIYANHINFSTSETENPAISSFFTSNGDGWSRKSSVDHVRTYITSSNVYNNLSSSTGASTNWDTVFQNGRSGFVDGWSGSNFPPGTSHVHGIQVRHSTGSHYGWQLLGQYGQPGKLYHRTVSNNTFSSWATMWSSINDGSGSGLDADTLDGIDSSAFLRSNASDTFTGQLTMGTQKALIASNYGHGVYGVYNAAKYQHVWSMGTSYSGPADGTSTGTVGNLYGLAWTYNPNYGSTGTNAQAISGLNHQLLLCMNGTTRTALGSGIWTEGNVTAYSDRRVKTNIELIPNALEKVQQLNGYTFDRTDIETDPATGETPYVRQTGVIAQEVLEVLPEAVIGTEERGYSVAYGNMVGLLIEAIKELKSEVEDLKSQLKEK